MTYILSDIHGQKKLFDKLLKKIEFSDQDELYVLGDVIDRGSDGIKLLLKAMNTKNIHMLLGNHELMMQQTICSHDRELMWQYAQMWFQNGGKITLNSFLKYSENTQKRILKYISKLPSELRITVNNKEFILCHAIPHPVSWKINPFENSVEGLRYNTEREMAAWERGLFFNDDNFKDKIIIHGHTSTKLHDKEGKMLIRMMDEKGYEQKDINKIREINIDCGCSRIPYGMTDGRLGCLRLEDMKEFYAG